MRLYKYRMFDPAILVSLAAIFIFVLTISCNDGNGCIDGSGSIVTVELELEQFHSVNTETSFQVLFEQGTEQLVLVEGHQNVINTITTEVSDGIWLISLTGNCYNNLDIVIHITLPTVKSIESAGSGTVILNSFDSLDQLSVLVSGSGQLFQSGVLNVSDRLTMQSTGSGDVTANFNTADLDVLVSGSATMMLSGTTNSQTVALTGSGNYTAFGLSSNSCTIENSGSGNAEVFVNNELVVTVSGSGNVSYKGDPAITPTITGSGQLIDAN